MSMMNIHGLLDNRIYDGTKSTNIGMIEGLLLSQFDRLNSKLACGNIIINPTLSSMMG